MKRSLAFLLATLALAGCGQDIYQRAATGPDQFAQDRASCRAYAAEQPPARLRERDNPLDPNGIANTKKVQDDIRSCMVAKGYSYEHTLGWRDPASQLDS